MIWLNNGLSLQYNGQNNCFEGSATESMQDTENEFVRIANLCSEVFCDLVENKINCEEACKRYSKIYCEFQSNSDNQFFGLYFRSLILCFISHSDEAFRNRDIRKDLIDTAKIIYEKNKPSNEKARMCCDLAFGKETEFQSSYKICKGTDIISSNLLKVGHTNNITWWLEDLMRFRTESDQLSEFDREFIDFLLEDVINCDDPFLTLAISVFFHFSTTTRKSLGEYARESMPCFNPRYELLTGILKFGEKSGDEDMGKRLEFVKLRQMPCFAVHFLHIIFCEMPQSEIVKQEYRISVCRYLEILSTYYNENENNKENNLRQYIPLYLSTINKEEKSTEKSLQIVYPSIRKGLPDEWVEKINKLPDYEISKYFDKSRQFMKEVETVIKNRDFYEDYSNISKFLNNDFFGCNQKLKEEIVQIVTKDMNSDQNDDDLNNNNENHQIGPKKESILNKINDLDESVIVSMMETLFEVDEHLEEKIELEQHLFDYIAENGDLPEYKPSWE